MRAYSSLTYTLNPYTKVAFVLLLIRFLFALFQYQITFMLHRLSSR